MKKTVTVIYELSGIDLVQIIRDHIQSLTGDAEAQRADVVFDEFGGSACVSFKAGPNYKTMSVK